MAAKSQTTVAEPPKATNEEPEEIIITSEDAEGTSTDKEFIKYIGVATNRIITKKDWKGIGIEGENVKDAEWNFGNGFRLPTKDFNEKQVHYLLKVDGRFKAVDK